MGYDQAPSDVQTGDTAKFSMAFGGDINDGKGHVTAFLSTLILNQFIKANSMLVHVH